MCFFLFALILFTLLMTFSVGFIVNRAILEERSSLEYYCFKTEKNLTSVQMCLNTTSPSFIEKYQKISEIGKSFEDVGHVIYPWYDRLWGAIYYSLEHNKWHNLVAEISFVFIFCYLFSSVITYLYEKIRARKYSYS